MMNEAIDPHAFAAALKAFVRDSQEVVWGARGWFSSFTGDGFLAFWPVTRARRDTVLRKIVGAMSGLFANFEQIHVPHFARNSHNFREDFALAFGIDEGHVAIVEVGSAITIVGKPVVGAVRMVEAAGEWEVFANNQPGAALMQQFDAGSLQGVDVKQVPVTTKEFDVQRAHSISYGGKDWKRTQSSGASASPD
jgi:class 3 adenylate cyclase